MANYWNKPRIVFMTWAVVELIGWLATHYWPAPGVNWVWTVLIIIGLVPMVRFMSMKSAKLRKIMILWVATMVIGMFFSFMAFRIETFFALAPKLGVFWLILMGVAFLINALWWTPRLFVIGGIVQIVAGLLPIFVPSLLFYQYLIAAVAGTGAMLILMPNK